MLYNIFTVFSNYKLKFIKHQKRIENTTYMANSASCYYSFDFIKPTILLSFPSTVSLPSVV
jgi:hypothetical protein